MAGSVSAGATMYLDNVTTGCYDGYTAINES